MPTVFDKCFDCTTVPEEQFDYHNFFPLYAPKDEVVWSESEESSEADSDTSEAPVYQPPPPSELEKRFAEASQGRSTLSRKQSTIFVRKSGFAPSKADERRLQQDKEEVDFGDISAWMESCKHPEDTASHLKNILKHFDPAGTGKLAKAQLKHILMKYGGEDALTEEEVEATLKRKNMNGNEIEYGPFCDALLERDPLEV